MSKTVVITANLDEVSLNFGETFLILSLTSRKIFVFTIKLLKDNWYLPKMVFY